MRTPRPAWGSRAHAPATETNFPVERFKDCQENKPCRVWFLGNVDECVVHWQAGNRSIPCLKLVPEDHCPFCEMMVPAKAGSDRLKPWASQYEGYAAALRMNPTRRIWEPVAVILTAGMLRKLATDRETGRLYPNLRGAIVSVWRRPQGNNKVLEFDFESWITPPIEAYDHRPIIERFFEPTLAVDLPTRPGEIPVTDGTWKPRPAPISAAARKRAEELAAELAARAAQGQPITAEELEREREVMAERDAAKAKEVMRRAKRNASEGKPYIADRDDMDRPHPADDHPFGWKPAPVLTVDELATKGTGKIIAEELAASLGADHPAKPKPSKGKGGAA